MEEAIEDEPDDFFLSVLLRISLKRLEDEIPIEPSILPLISFGISGRLVFSFLGAAEASIMVIELLWLESFLPWPLDELEL